MPRRTAQSQLVQLGASYAELRAPAGLHGLRLAHSTDPHPALTDQQVTALLRDALEAQGSAVLRPLLGRVSWQLRDDTVMLVCMARDLQAVTEHLRIASWLALTAILPERSVSVVVQIGQPAPTEVRPCWLDEHLWGRVPQWFRPQLVGSVLLDGRLYGATAERTADLDLRSEIVTWLLDQLVLSSKHETTRGLFQAEEREAGGLGAETPCG